MTVTGNGLNMHEKLECAVCGRTGFVRFDGAPPHVLHPYSEPCYLPPRVTTVRVRAHQRTVVHVRRFAA